MYVKYRQDNLHHITWYTGTCNIMAMGLLYMLALWSNVQIIWALDPIVVSGRRNLKWQSLQDGHSCVPNIAYLDPLIYYC